MQNIPEKSRQIPTRHREIIDALATGERLQSLVFVPEGSYVKVENEGRAANFISCPAIIIEHNVKPIQCLHVTYDELLAALENEQFNSSIDFKQFDKDIKEAKRIRILLAKGAKYDQTGSEKLDVLLRVIQKKNENVRAILVNHDQFQLVITREGISIWSGTKNIGMV